MQIHNNHAALRQVPFFAGLSEEDLAELSSRLVVRRFNPGQVIFHFGDPGGLLYIIRKGKIKISHATADGQEALLAILGKDDFFGELALLDEAPRSASAQALEKTETLTLHREEFLHFLRQNPDFALHVLRTLTLRIRHLNSQVSDTFFLDLPARLARTLLNLARQHGVQTSDGVLIELSLTQTDLAEMTGATRVSINKALGRFRREKWIAVKGRKFTILDEEAMQNVIQISGGSV
jgi:CRP/FNR family transcriptional regulator, cyclic AMP receptor protein